MGIYQIVLYGALCFLLSGCGQTENFKREEFSGKEKISMYSRATGFLHHLTDDFDYDSMILFNSVDDREGERDSGIGFSKRKSEGFLEGYSVNLQSFRFCEIHEPVLLDGKNIRFVNTDLEGQGMLEGGQLTLTGDISSKFCGLGAYLEGTYTPFAEIIFTYDEGKIEVADVYKLVLLPQNRAENKLSLQGIYNLLTSWDDEWFGNNAEDKLHNALNRYKESFESKDYIMMASMILPQYIESLGGSEEFVKLMKTLPDLLAQQGMKVDTQQLKLGSPGTIATHAYLYASVIPTTLPVEIQGVKGIITGSIIALSGDKGESWFFLEGNNEGKAGLEGFIPGILQRIELPDPTIEINDKIFVQRDGQWVEQ